MASTGFGMPQNLGDIDSVFETMAQISARGPQENIRIALENGCDVRENFAHYRNGGTFNESHGEGSLIEYTMEPPNAADLIPGPDCLADLIYDYVTTKADAERFLNELIKKFPNLDSDELAEYKASKQTGGQMGRTLSSGSQVSSNPPTPEDLRNARTARVDAERKVMGTMGSILRANENQNASAPSDQGTSQYSGLSTAGPRRKA